MEAGNSEVGNIISPTKSGGGRLDGRKEGRSSKQVTRCSWDERLQPGKAVAGEASYYFRTFLLSSSMGRRLLNSEIL